MPRRKPTPRPETDQAAVSTDPLVRLDHWFAAHRKRFVKELRPGASPADLDALQAALGKPVPDELRHLLAWHDGQTEGSQRRFMEDWLLLGCKDIPDARRELKDAATDWLPFPGNDDGAFVCLDLATAGVPVRESWPGKKDAPTVAGSLTAWLEEFVSAVEQGRYVEDPERGSFLRRPG